MKSTIFLLASFSSMENVEAIKSEHKLMLDNKIETEVANKAEWGFLKNVVNINTFFSSGSDAKSESKSSKKSFKKLMKKIKKDDKKDDVIDKKLKAEIKAEEAATAANLKKSAD